MLIQPRRIPEGNYLDNFIKIDSGEQSRQSRANIGSAYFSRRQDEGLAVEYNERPTLELDQFLSGKYPRNSHY